ncbi:MAG: hypothetical protein CVV64_20610 [Candidatus Wallbacteria bacterium HGW-Wallbacteria-1]|jgi:RNA polymerase sigma-70 factor (ECF subfamily)|uniref:RNA polymerase subunit sigma-24 n=1 Tax=Candidatus Wallbacteria bacterium HGW-Wallbacteria-1 TaxID=2013854 RepID=A0A2N1PI67_9BACT|nr:MAG: hypothetical protein CVV64_20610 [Candidatus Wallbacteria bacterium HGW-Wallbacteria-1]
MAITPSDLELIELVKDGELDYYEDLITRYRRVVFNFAYLKLNEPSVAEDVSQETFLKAYRSLAKYNPEYKFVTWLLAICNNVCINHFNQEKKKLIYLRQKALEDGIPPSRPNAFELLDTTDYVRSIIKDLEREDRLLLLLRFWQELSHNEISEIMDMPSGTVRSKLCRLLKRLRENLNRTKEREIK